MSLLPLADYSDDSDEEEHVASSSKEPPAPPPPVARLGVPGSRDVSLSPSPSRDSPKATNRTVSGLVKLRNTDGGSPRGATPISERTPTPGPLEPSAGSEQLPLPAEDVTVDVVSLQSSRRNEILGLPNGPALPPEPEMPVDPELQAKMEKWTQLRNSGTSFNRALMNNAAFRNPGIMGKLIEFLDLDEYGSNYPKEEHDPRGFQPDSYLEELLKAQARKSDRFTGAGSAPAAQPPPGNRQISFESNVERVRAVASAMTTKIRETKPEEPPKKRSKWD